MKLKVRTSAVTPLVQIESSETRMNAKSGHEKKVITVKTRIIIDGNDIVKIPVYS